MRAIDVVSNTSPLIFLERINALFLLKECFRKVYIPEQVKLEWGKEIIPGYITVHSVSDFGKNYVNGAVGRLHRGELEAIQLAQELNCDVILLDDLLARRTAKKKGKTPLGVLGVLKLAFKLDLLSFEEINLKIADLINNHGLYLSNDILERYLDSLQ